jgi:hypothetical protein
LRRLRESRIGVRINPAELLPQNLNESADC